MEIEAALERSYLFKGVSLDKSRLSIKRLRKGQMAIDSRGDVPCVCMVLQGIIDVYSVALDGREVKLSALAAGETFGICNLFVQNEMTTVLRSGGRSAILLIPKDYLLVLMKEDFDLACRYAMLLNEKIQFLLHRIEELTMQTSRGKLLDYLRSRADEQGKVAMGLSREELARYLGISRAALFREIARLKEQREIVSCGCDLYVKRPGYLMPGNQVKGTL